MMRTMCKKNQVLPPKNPSPARNIGLLNQRTKRKTHHPKEEEDRGKRWRTRKRWILLHRQRKRGRNRQRKASPIFLGGDRQQRRVMSEGGARWKRTLIMRRKRRRSKRPRADLPEGPEPPRIRRTRRTLEQKAREEEGRRMTRMTWTSMWARWTSCSKL